MMHTWVHQSLLALSVPLRCVTQHREAHCLVFCCCSVTWLSGASQTCRRLKPGLPTQRTPWINTSHNEERHRSIQMSERKRSVIWLYFIAENETTASCIVCSRAVKYNGNTKNLYKHMKNHAAENTELQKQRRGETSPIPWPRRPRPTTQRQQF